MSIAVKESTNGIKISCTKKKSIYNYIATIKFSKICFYISAQSIWKCQRKKLWAFFIILLVFLTLQTDMKTSSRGLVHGKWGKKDKQKGRNKQINKCCICHFCWDTKHSVVESSLSSKDPKCALQHPRGRGKTVTEHDLQVRVEVL